ncbi:MAG: cell division protein [Eikenella sp.]|nr:cell division protein [Eikenella sp.]
MKWLFAILVALNIMVFGGMLFSRMAAPQQQQAAVPPAAAQPTVVQIHTGNPQQTTPAAPQSPQAGSAPAPATQRTPAAAPRRTNETAGKPADPAAPKNSDSGIRAPATACTAVAVMPEDDYHRIKGLLSRWPHSATRVVERRQNSRQSAARYQVSVAVEGNEQETAAKLKSLGFSTAPAGGRLNIGTFNNEQQAERAAARARQAGLVPQINRTGQGGSEQSAALGESKMQLTFINVDDAAATGISGVIGRYAALRRAPCRR